MHSSRRAAMNGPQQSLLTVGLITCVGNAECVHHCHVVQLFSSVKEAMFHMCLIEKKKLNKNTGMSRIANIEANRFGVN